MSSVIAWKSANVPIKLVTLGKEITKQQFAIQVPGLQLLAAFEMVLQEKNKLIGIEMNIYRENPGIKIYRENPETPVLAELTNTVIFFMYDL